VAYQPETPVMVRAALQDVWLADVAEVWQETVPFQEPPVAHGSPVL
jgi:hypothetical protein